MVSTTTASATAISDTGTQHDRTLITSRANMGHEPPATGTSTSSGLMLQEWSYPVPAVVVDLEEVPLDAAPPSAAEDTGASSGSPQSTRHERVGSFSAYPVATIVRDFVRTTAEQIHDHIQAYHQDVMASSGSSQQHQHRHSLRDTHQVQHHMGEEGNRTTSVRSEADTQARSSMVAAAASGQDSSQHHHTVSARTVDGYMNEEAEHILVDGDLIAVPLINRGDDHGPGGQRGYSQKTCRPSRMKRGVRMISKWLGRGKKKNNVQSEPVDVAGVVPHSLPTSSQAAAVAAELSLPGVSSLTGDSEHPSVDNIGPSAAPAASYARQPSIDDASSHSNPSQRRNSSKKNKPGKANRFEKRKSDKPQKSTRKSLWQQKELTRQRATSDGQNYFHSPEENDRDQRQQQQQLQQVSPPNRLRAQSTDTGLLAAARIQPQREQLPGINPPPAIPELAPMEGQRSAESVVAQEIGTQDEDGVFQLQLQPGFQCLPPATTALAFVEDEYDDEAATKEKKEDIPVSMVPSNADFKVDKADAPDVESMLLRASYETNMDLENPVDALIEAGPKPRTRGKSDGTSVPLSVAKRTDKLVHNDMLKVVLVGSVGLAKSQLARAIRESPKKPRKRTTLGLDVHTWSASDINFQIWDVQGSTSTGATDHSPNFGAHPGTQSLFFSSESLYLLVWDLACHNPHASPSYDFESDEEDEEYANAYVKEQAMAEADRALQEDITQRVLAWVDRIARRASTSAAILPVAIIPEGMEESEVERRTKKMFEMLENHVKWHGGKEDMPNIILDDSRNVLSVNYYSNNFGVKRIQETLVAIATDSSGSVFQHINTPVPPGTVEVCEYVRSVKRDHKLIRLDHILGVLGENFPIDRVVRALHFLDSIGEILYYGTEHDDVLSSFVILSRQWLVSALSCILRNDLKRELADARKFMNMQCIYSEQKFQENEVIKALGGGDASNCPLLTDDDAAMLWRSMSFMREAADKYSQLNESTTSGPTIFYFLERLLVHFGIFIPFGDLDHGHAAGLEKSSEVFFIPSLLCQADPLDTWLFRSKDSWTTTLCHSFLFRDGAPMDLFEHVAVAVLRDVYKFSQEFSADMPVLRDVYKFSQEFSADLPGMPIRDLPTRARTTPLGRASRHEFAEEHKSNPVGPVNIHQVICWKKALLLKIGTIFPDRESGELRESFVEVFVTIVDQNSPHCVASDAMRGNMQRVVVSGKGPSGLNGLKLWRGGYRAVLDSVKSSLESFNNVNMQVVCSECLARVTAGRASTWGWDEVAAAAEERRESTIVCRRGHRVKSGLLCGTCKEEKDYSGPIPDQIKTVPDLLPSVVLIGLWDPRNQEIRSVGSGFVADKKGLVVTAGHVLFDMTEGQNFGTRFLGIQDAKIAIGVVPGKGKNNAVWRYFAEILADDVRNNVDACVLRITTKMEQDVDDDTPGSNNPEILLDPVAMKNENLDRLKVESNFELEQNVRILGYSQREGKEDGGGARHHIIRSPDFARGYICRLFSLNADDSSSSSSSSSDSESKNTFSPREEIVVRCPTIVGHSGGPCVNDDGLVVGILSRVDPTDPHLCYLVPATQLKTLVRRARSLCSRSVFPSTTREMPIPIQSPSQRYAQSI